VAAPGRQKEAAENSTGHSARRLTSSAASTFAGLLTAAAFTKRRRCPASSKTATLLLGIEQMPHSSKDTAAKSLSVYM
jgi:hypothetical protein